MSLADDVNVIAAAVAATAGAATALGGFVVWVTNRNQKRRAAIARSVADVRTDLESQIRETRDEFRRELAESKNEVAAFINKVDSYFQTLRAECATRTEIERIGSEIGRVHARIDELFRIRTPSAKE